MKESLTPAILLAEMFLDGLSSCWWKLALAMTNATRDEAMRFRGGFVRP